MTTKTQKRRITRTHAMDVPVFMNELATRHGQTHAAYLLGIAPSTLSSNIIDGAARATTERLAEFIVADEDKAKVAAKKPVTAVEPAPEPAPALTSEPDFEREISGAFGGEPGLPFICVLRVPRDKLRAFDLMCGSMGLKVGVIPE